MSLILFPPSLFNLFGKLIDIGLRGFAPGSCFFIFQEIDQSLKPLAIDVGWQAYDDLILCAFYKHIYKMNMMPKEFKTACLGLTRI